MYTVQEQKCDGVQKFDRLDDEVLFASDSKDFCSLCALFLPVTSKHILIDPFT